MIIAFQAHGTAGRVFKMTVGHAVAHAFQLDRWSVGAVDATKIPNARVHDLMQARRQRRAITTDDFRATSADGMDVTTDDVIAETTVDHNAICCHFSDCATDDAQVAAIGQFHAMHTTTIEHQTFEAHVLHRIKIGKSLRLIA
ncbi:MAG: hypothetical protein RLZZ224_490 [Verrucomicrobiota bacterium]